jgi:thiamine pyrophosphokinase
MDREWRLFMTRISILRICRNVLPVWVKRKLKSENRYSSCSDEVVFYETDTSKFTVVVLGGLSGRLDQTIHTLSVFHKLRESRPKLFAITNENIGWVLDSVRRLVLGFSLMD